MDGLGGSRGEGWGWEGGFSRSGAVAVEEAGPTTSTKVFGIVPDVLRDLDDHHVRIVEPNGGDDVVHELGRR
jgi:hypothetical protein